MPCNIAQPYTKLQEMALMAIYIWMCCNTVECIWPPPHSIIMPDHTVGIGNVDLLVGYLAHTDASVATYTGSIDSESLCPLCPYPDDSPNWGRISSGLRCVQKTQVQVPSQSFYSHQYRSSTIPQLTCQEYKYYLTLWMCSAQLWWGCWVLECPVECRPL